MNEVISVDPATPDFVVAKARKLVDIQDYFPGRDYPDREVWLKKRDTPRGQLHGAVIYSGRKPLALGINQAKRFASRDAFYAGESPNPKHCRGKRIVAHRHAYYRDRYEVQS